MDPKTGELAQPNIGVKPMFDGPHTPTIEEIKKTPQFLAREEMAKRVYAQRSIEDKEFRPDILDEDGNITPAPPVNTEVEAAQEGQQEEAAQEIAQEDKSEEPAQQAEEEPEEERELIVDGKKIRVPISKILDAGVRTLQKETAADQRLAAATELERRLREAAERIQPPQGVDRTVVQQPQEVVQPSQEDAALAHDIQFGTEEESARAIAKLRATGRGVDHAQLQHFVQASIPDQIAFYNANERIRNDYKEIFADPDYAEYFMLQETKARQAGDRRPYQELYQDIAKTMVTKFAIRPAEVREPKATSLQERVVRKASAPKVANSAAAVSNGTPEVKRPQTTAEYVTAMRQKRGLQPIQK